MSSVSSTLASLVIFLLPGFLIVSVFAGSKRIRLSLGEQLYLVLAGSLLVSGWVGLLAAELGLFSPAHVAFIVAGLTLCGAFAMRKRMAFRLGPFRWEELLVAVCLLGFAIMVYYPPFEYILGGRDPGIYVNTGFHLARHGELTFTDPVIKTIPPDERALFFPDKELEPWSLFRYQGYEIESPETARIVPQGLHLYPVWIGLVSGLYQIKSGLWVTPTFALMGVAALFLAVRRLFGAETALWATGLMAVFQIQIWFARFPNSEILVQFLYLTGIFLFSLSEDHRSSFAGALAGAALGATLLTRLESILLLIPIGLYMGWKRLRHEIGKPELAFLIAFTAVAAHAALHARLVSWPYVSSILGRHYWRWLGDNLALVALIAVAAIVLIDRVVVRVPLPRLDEGRSSLLRYVAAGGIALLGFYDYFVRPVWHGARTAPHDAEAFLRMGWYLYPAGLALALAGVMVLVVRSKRSQTFFLLVGLTFSLFFFYKARVWHDHFFAMRRYIPIILPSFFVAIAVFLTSLVVSRPRWLSWVPRIIGSLLIVTYLSDGRRLWRHNEFGGSIDFVEELARYINDEDIVIFPRREGLHLLELPLAEMQGKNVLEFYTLKPDRRLLESLLKKWRGLYEDVYFVTNYKISLSGLFTRHVQDFWFTTQKYEYAYTRPPAGPEPFSLRFTLSKAVDLEDLSRRVPALPYLDIGGSDDLQVAWFHEKELDEDGTSYRWTQRTSTVFLPTLGRDSKQIRIRMAGPKESEAPLNPVEVCVHSRCLETISPTREFETYTIELPSDLVVNNPGSFGILRLETKTWRPSNWIPDATDIRELGARVDWIEVK
jgi:hypothetical protein